jgi:aspartyl-tRNA(Asn)/glutamyl-tRNA(Gln) amidotransferase subunit C
MSVTVRDVEHVAKLARLTFSEEAMQKFTHQLNDILAYMEKLNSLDTANVEPLSHVIDLSNVMRDDAVTPSLPQETVLRNAPDRTEKFFRVPKVIGDR